MLDRIHLTQQQDTEQEKKKKKKTQEAATSPYKEQLTSESPLQNGLK